MMKSKVISIHRFYLAHQVPQFPGICENGSCSAFKTFFSTPFQVHILVHPTSQCTPTIVICGWKACRFSLFSKSLKLLEIDLSKIKYWESWDDRLWLDIFVLDGCAASLLREIDLLWSADTKSTSVGDGNWQVEDRLEMWPSDCKSTLYYMKHLSTGSVIYNVKWHFKQMTGKSSDWMQCCSRFPIGTNYR